MRKHLELLPPSERSKAMGRLRREGFTVSPSATANRLAIVASMALRVSRPRTIDEAAALIKRYLTTPEVDTGYGEVRNWVPYVQSVEMGRVLARAANPYEKQPGDGR